MIIAFFCSLWPLSLFSGTYIHIRPLDKQKVSLVRRWLVCAPHFSHRRVLELNQTTNGLRSPLAFFSTGDYDSKKARAGRWVIKKFSPPSRRWTNGRSEVSWLLLPVNGCIRKKPNLWVSCMLLMFALWNLRRCCFGMIVLAIANRPQLIKMTGWITRSRAVCFVLFCFVVFPH